MVTEMNLKGNDLIAYAIIYGFSQDGESVFSGTASYLSEWLNVDRRSVHRILDRLIEAGFIKKIEKTVNGVKLCDYQTTRIKGDDKMSQPCDKLSYPPCDKLSHHNNIIDKDRDINNILVNPAGLPPAPFDDSDVIQRWNTIAEKYNLPKVLMLTPKRKNKLSRVLKENKVTIDEYFATLDSAIKVSLFLRGIKVIYEGGESRIENKDWKSSFDFFLGDGKFLKTREGNYADPDLL